MAFKRSAVRSRLSPPSLKRVKRKPHFFGNEVFVLCGKRHDVQHTCELLKVDIEVNVRFVVLIDRHPLAQAGDDHFFASILAVSYIFAHEMILRP